VSFSGPVVAGQTITLQCPEGHMLEVTADGPNASANFYRNEKRRNAVGEFVPPSSTTTTTASWIAPKGARFADATAYCVPTTTTVSFSGFQVADEIQHADCPAEYPYVTSTFRFIGDADGDLSTTDDQFLVNSRFILRLVGNDPGVPNYTGFEFRLEPGMAWYGEVVCSVFPAT
jgi:hypothetical protein